MLSSLAAGVSFAMREGDRLLVAAGVLGVGAMLGTWRLR
jgi:hypothetical protein